MLRNAPLRSKLIVTLIGPLLALMVLAAVVIRRSRHGGVGALVLLPASLIVQSESPTRNGPPVVPPASDRVAQRSRGEQR